MCDRVYIQTNTLDICAFQGLQLFLLMYVCKYGLQIRKRYLFKHDKFSNTSPIVCRLKVKKVILLNIAEKNFTNHFVLIYSPI